MSRILGGNDWYHILLWFLTYSILGWVVESAYMSLCNRKWTNRGFARGPICPIYGVGALTVFFALNAYQGNRVQLFIMGALLATFIEWLTARIMNRVFGEVWWDYKDKPFNYKGILCLESTIAWGFYTLFLFGFLHTVVERIVNVIPFWIGRILGVVLVIGFSLDFLYSLYVEKKDSLPDKVTEIRDMIIDRIWR
ncbi:putative ABC transporter permease [Hespellia stercorisuis]|uniref:Putative ABC-transporter type IV n=1 Tax=Hespellia stercorisuis DSM 15480 TaxID=1121950 RepID=A0A1M6HLK6_9FIRM|nr:putative ABC transporter permease [Hespellia stercorisuis]SHJ23071.1 Putative ABC-transporter type IV [Hespellia stercorisuis DSM 15480]